MLYDLAIVGGGPAGVAGGVYAARQRLRTIFLTQDFNGQSVVSPEIQNWIGTKSISGQDLAKQLREHLLNYEGEILTVKSEVKVLAIKKSVGYFSLATDKNEVYEARTILLAVGASRRRLTVPGAAQYEQKGLTYCATCDGPLFADQAVAVIGGGNAAFETALQLAAYCQKVTILEYTDAFRADKVTVEKILANPKIKAQIQAETLEIKGDQFVQSLIYRDLKTGKKQELPVTGIFVEIGVTPNTALVKDLVKLNASNFIVVDPRTQRTSELGLWAAGDCTDGLYKQNNIAVGDAIKAVEDIYDYLTE